MKLLGKSSLVGFRSAKFLLKYFQKRILSCLVTALLLITAFPIFAQQVTDSIQINQIGFYVQATKVAVITAAVPSDRFYVTSTNLRDTVFSGKLTAERASAYSSVKTRVADFSSLNRKGSFVVLVPGLGHSYVFQIGDSVHQPLAKAALKGFYYQRVSVPLEERYAGKWHRSAGHPDTVVIIHPSAASKNRTAGTVISSPGGWYDAGDYNKYIVNSGITMGTLFSAYEDFPDYFKKLNTNIPESGNEVPDVLNEALYNLRWMLTMQDPGDGGVYNKCTNAAFDGMVMPGVTRATRYVVQKGTAATLDFAAVTAQASRIFRNFSSKLPGLADSCAFAAKKAWDWALAHPSMEYDQAKMNLTFQPEISTGGYGDKTFDDEWFWAATELLATTKDQKYVAVVNQHVGKNWPLPSWSNVGMLGVYTLLRFPVLPGVDAKSYTQMKSNITRVADEYLSNKNSNAFATVMGQSVRDYNWGGNANAANQGILLIKAFLLNGNKKYTNGALSNLDYICGRNATGYCFVTGMGSKSPMHPHHRPSIADGITDPVPGLLSGGPNPGMQDHCKYEFTEPETAYSDNECSYASNEIAINWNAPLVYLANALEALQKASGYAK
jgi:endoglucanase